MAKPGPNNALTDVAGLQVGHAHDAGIKTGTTVILPDRAATAAVAVAGGGPGTRETDLLRAGNMVDHVDAIVLSGGSAFGLGAADGVAGMLCADGRGFGLVDRPGVPKTPIVPAAILYDLANGGDKDWGASPPYAALGQAAYAAASNRPELGRVGAGFGAQAGSHPGGIGTASIVTHDGMTIAALAAVNAFGSVYMPGTDVFWAWPFEIENEFGGQRPGSDYRSGAEDWGDAKSNPALGENTTIACIATDADLTPSETQRVASMALAGFARAIRPVFAPFDGDVAFVLSTAKRPLPEPRPHSLARIGECAASTLARAIARGVWHARGKD
ncbi:MAG: P1 family peptidase [Pseudomonadota bacterium]